LFFFQAEDGIRDGHVTGVQTCALPICLLRELGWGRSLTEDWELTLRLYAKGYKVVYTPYAETPAECVATFGRLARQRMRWAEGQIGRASCRERGWGWEWGGGWESKRGE